MYELIERGLCRNAGFPDFGKQDRGVTPGGVMDQFSAVTGNLMLGNPSEAQTLEIVIPPVIRFTESCYAVLTGAAYDSVYLSQAEVSPEISHAKVFKVTKGATLRFGKKQYGFRTYLSCRLASETPIDLGGRKRGPNGQLFGWSEPDNTVRVMKGSEYQYLERPEDFVDHPWKVGNDLSNMGMRLTCLRKMPSVSLENMISGAVSDGTVQLTPTGPIVLLRHRQTVGGYPRIFNVISADIDTLGQYQPGQIIRFKLVTNKTARMIARQKADVVEHMKRLWSL